MTIFVIALMEVTNLGLPLAPTGVSIASMLDSNPSSFQAQESTMGSATVAMQVTNISAAQSASTTASNLDQPTKSEKSIKLNSLKAEIRLD